MTDKYKIDEQGNRVEVVEDRALRFNEGKLKWSLLPWDALSVLVRHYMMGAKKYAPRNWEKGMSYTETYEALMRHLQKWYAGEETEVDPVTGEEFLHLTAVFWNAAALLTFTIRGMDRFDDRPSKVKLHG